MQINIQKKQKDFYQVFFDDQESILLKNAKFLKPNDQFYLEIDEQLSKIIAAVRKAYEEKKKHFYIPWSIYTKEEIDSDDSFGRQIDIGDKSYHSFEWGKNTYHFYPDEKKEYEVELNFNISYFLRYHYIDIELLYVNPTEIEI